MQYKAVLFDMDGVLIDSEPGYNQADRLLFERLGIPYGRREIEALTGISLKTIGGLLLGWYPDLPHTNEELVAMQAQCLLDSLKQGVTELVPGAHDWISRLKKAGVKLAIGSSSTNDMVYYVARRFGLDALMDTIVTCEDVKHAKPWPDIYLSCADRLGVRPADCLVIEDSTNGIKAARAADMPCAAFLGTNRHGLDTSQAQFTFANFDEKAYLALFE